MASGKTPTRRQREVIERYRLNSGNWLIRKNPPGEMHLIHRLTGRKRILFYSEKGGRKLEKTGV
ncbi:DUF6906 family protein [Syntrophomonas curvata]